MATNKITFWQLLQNNHIEIPIIQRDYAQGREGKEYLRRNFLASLKQALNGKPLKLDFVYGSVENNKLQPLDGQQRLTTLWLLHWYIALFANKYKEAFGVLSRFSYETRISSREFIQSLCNPKNFESFDKKDVVKFIKDATWYYSAWNQDPTISSMLRMIKGTNIGDKRGEDIIDGLDELFVNAGENEFEEYWKQLTETDAIVFYQQPLEDFGLSDDLYVKMNARGKQLSSFENFKADLIDYLHEQEKDTMNCEDLTRKWKDLLDPQEGIPIRLDTEWTQLFWKNRSTDYKIDEIFFAFINRFFWNELFIAKKSDNNYILILSAESKNSSYEYFNTDAFDKYVGFDPYRFYMGAIPATFFEKLKTIIHNYSSFQGIIPEPKWMNGFDFIPTYKNDTKGKDEIKISGINQLQRIIFFSICKYFNEGAADQKSLNRWMRVVYNLISGVDRTGKSEIRDVENVRKAIVYLDSLDSHNVILSLANKKNESENGATALLTRRWNEEIVKALKINNEPIWENRIIEAEEYSFFHGSIRFLFTDENGSVETNWQNFDTKWTNVQKFFAKDDNQQSVMNNDYHNTKLLKILFSRFSTENFRQNLWWNYRTFNNKANTWMYYLLSPNLSYSTHYLLLGFSRDTQWETTSEDFDKNTLHLLSHTNLLDYVRTEMNNSWIRNYNYHRTIYPSSTGIFLDAYLRDEFLLNTDEIFVEENAKIPDTPLLFGWDINFQYKQYRFQWYRTDYIYLMEKCNKDSYVVRNYNGSTEEEKYFCFNTKNLTKEDIIFQLNELLSTQTL